MTGARTRTRFPEWAPEAAVTLLELRESQNVGAHRLAIMRRLLTDPGMRLAWATLARCKVNPALFTEVVAQVAVEKKNTFALLATHQRKAACTNIAKHTMALREALAAMPAAFASDREWMMLDAIEARARSLLERAPQYGRADKDQDVRAFVIDLTAWLQAMIGQPLRAVVAACVAAAFEIDAPSKGTITRMAGL